MRNGLAHVRAYGSEPGIRTIEVTRYVTPLREGGSLPAVVEGDDLGTYVLKFRGAGQGPKVLIAELIAGEIARELGLPMPEIVFAQLDPILARSEPDPEIQALLRASAGLNLALDYLPGSFAYEPGASPPPDADLASAIVWFDAYLTNVDRTVRNTNLLVWHHNLWLIDNGAALYFHHNWPGFMERARSPFTAIQHHVLLPYASAIPTMANLMASRLAPDLIRDIVDLVPEGWLAEPSPFTTVQEHRDAYVEYLTARLEASPIFSEEAVRARAAIV
jgi:hypothetical protein